MKPTSSHNLKSIGLVCTALIIAALCILWWVKKTSRGSLASSSAVPTERVAPKKGAPAPAAGVIKVAPPSAKAPAEVAAFRDWAQSFFDVEPLQRSALIEQGKALAKAHTIALAKMIPLDPRAAIENAVPMVVRQDLPPQIVALLEERVNSRGALTLWGTVPKAGEES
jgi:hypothetical protein